MFADACPETAENFLQLCVGTKNKAGKTLRYRGYDVIKTMEAVGSRTGKTSSKVTIGDCGIVQQFGLAHHMSGIR